MKQFLIATLLIFSVLQIQAQEGWEAGAWAGGAWYFGDLNSDFSLNRPGLATGITARYNFNERICFKFGGSYGRISADDADSDNTFHNARNLRFQSDVGDISGMLEFNFLEYIHGSRDQFFTPYLAGGFAVYNFSPEAEYNGEMYELRSLGTEGQFTGEEYATTQVALAYGGGFKIALNYEWSLNLDISARRLFTDYLDDVSTTYADKDDLEQLRGDVAVALSDPSIPIEGVNSSEIGLPGRQRGNSANNDSYVFVGVNLIYYFGDLRCPTYGRRR